MCKNSGEFTDHLHIHCDFTQYLWLLVFCLFGLHCVMFKRVVDLLACWKGGFGDIVMLTYGGQFGDSIMHHVDYL